MRLPSTTNEKVFSLNGGSPINSLRQYAREEQQGDTASWLLWIFGLVDKLIPRVNYVAQFGCVAVRIRTQAFCKPSGGNHIIAAEFPVNGYACDTSQQYKTVGGLYVRVKRN